MSISSIAFTLYALPQHSSRLSTNGYPSDQRAVGRGRQAGILATIDNRNLLCVQLTEHPDVDALPMPVLRQSRPKPTATSGGGRRTSINFGIRPIEAQPGVRRMLPSRWLIEYRAGTPADRPIHAFTAVPKINR